METFGNLAWRPLAYCGEDDFGKAESALMLIRLSTFSLDCNVDNLVVDLRRGTRFGLQGEKLEFSVGERTPEMPCDKKPSMLVAFSRRGDSFNRATKRNRLSCNRL